MPGKMLSLVSVAALMAAVAAHPYPQCEPCDKVTDVDLETLGNLGKYLCCDLSCETDPVAGCGIFGLDIVCKACYDGDDTPAYDDDPIDGSDPSPSTTPAPVAEEPQPAPAPVAEEMPVMPATTPAPATPEPVMMPVAAPVAEPEMPVMMPTETDTDGSMSYGFDPVEEECTACDEASMVLTEMDWEVLEADGYELVCDLTCFEDATMDGCGAFDLPIECRAVPIDDSPSPVPAPSPVATGSDEGEGSGSDSEQTGSDEGEGGGSDSEGTGSDEGEGGGSDSEGTGSDEGEGGGEDGAGGCTAEEIAMCADISPAQEEALAMYDGGGKVIVCDPTCNDGVSDPSHCDYFGLGQRCRGCGACSECVPCP